MLNERSERRPLRRRGWLANGALAGLIGGAVMGLYLVVASAVLGYGGAYPLNVIGYTLVRVPPVPVAQHLFYWAPNDVAPLLGLQVRTLVGLLLHLVMSVAMGIGIGWVMTRFRQLPIETKPQATLFGVICAVGIWTIFGLVVGTLIDPALMLGPPPPHWSIGHVLYGVVTCLTMFAWLPARPRFRVTWAPTAAERTAEVERTSQL